SKVNCEKRRDDLHALWKSAAALICFVSLWSLLQHMYVLPCLHWDGAGIGMYASYRVERASFT
ncbi:hypothetical protein KZ287_33630, partial [Escherichia coli]|nr:hypothetical protein [Escherichia coli]